MELLCWETVPSEVRAESDKTIREDPRVLTNMLTTEVHYGTQDACALRGQIEIKPNMRKVLTTWMLEVCDDQKCEDAVFLLAVNILDRFLCQVTIPKNQLQLLGAACLLIASKIRHCRTLGGEQLCYYTDYSITLEKLLNWELLVLSKLQWDVSAVIPCDYVDIFIHRVPLLPDSAKIRQHTMAFIALCATESEYCVYAPSLIAAACFCVAAAGLGVKPGLVNTMVTILAFCTKHSTELLHNCINQVEKQVNNTLPCVQQVALSTGNANKSNMGYVTSKTTSSGSQPETPTDIQDVHF